MVGVANWLEVKVALIAEGAESRPPNRLRDLGVLVRIWQTQRGEGGAGGGGQWLVDQFEPGGRPAGSGVKATAHPPAVAKRDVHQMDPMPGARTASAQPPELFAADIWSTAPTPQSD